MTQQKAKANHNGGFFDAMTTHGRDLPPLNCCHVGFGKPQGTPEGFFLEKSNPHTKTVRGLIPVRPKRQQKHATDVMMDWKHARKGRGQ